MARVIETDAPRRVQCDTCGAVIEYRPSEISWRSVAGSRVERGYIRCPNTGIGINNHEIQVGSR